MEAYIVVRNAQYLEQIAQLGEHRGGKESESEEELAEAIDM